MDQSNQASSTTTAPRQRKVSATQMTTTSFMTKNEDSQVPRATTSKQEDHQHDLRNVNQRKKQNQSGLEQNVSGEQIQMERNLNLWNGVSIIIGVIVGSGIFITPRGVLESSGSIGASLLVWSLCGLFALLGALCFAELGTSIRSSGGDYTYVRLAYGPLPGYLYLWVMVLVILPCGNAVAALTFANYCLQPLYPHCQPPEESIRLLALAILSLLIYINCSSVKGSIQLQSSSTLAKVLALVAIIAFGLYYMFTDRASNFSSRSSIWDGSESSISRLASAFYSGFYTYSGWNSLNCATEEMKNPVKNIPRALVLSLTGITLIYVLTNAAYFSVLSKEQILHTDAIGVAFGEQALGSSYARWLMPVAVAISTMGGLNGGIFAASRVLYAGARQGQLFSALQTIHHRTLSPIPALLFLGLISALYLVTTQIQSLINYVVFVEATFSALAVSTVFALRHKLPNIARPIRVPNLIPVIYLLFSFLLIVLPIYESPFNALIGFAITLTGLPVYWLTARWRNKPETYQKSLDKFNLIAQKLTLSVMPTLDDDLVK